MSDNVFILILICLIFYYFKSDIDSFINRSAVCNGVDSRCYPVFEHFEDPISASEMLAYLNLFAIKLMRHLRQKYLWNNSNVSFADQRMVKNLLLNYNPDSIVENNPNSNVNTSYIEDKGKVFAMCLREKKSGKNIIHSKNTLEFVLMHEMSHLASDMIGHEGTEFWLNFKKLIQNAEECGIHTPVNYELSPVNYCSLDVNYNPYFDQNLQ
jgi:hypothetical protein